MGKSSLVSLLVFASIASASSAQPMAEFPDLEIRRVERIYLDDVHPGVGGERVVDLYFRALSKHMQPVENLRFADAVIREDQRTVSKGDIVHLVPEEENLIATLEDAGLGVTCVLALDTSRTMIGEPFERARSAAVRFLDQLGTRDEAAIVTFASEVKEVAAFADPPPKARGRLTRMEIDQDAMSTVLHDGLYRAVELIRRGADLPRRAFVIVFTDGRDGGSGRSLHQVIQLAKGDETEPRIPIFAVGYAGRGVDGLGVLEELAAETGGDFEREASLKQFYEDILRQMRSSYVLRYESDMDGNGHRVEVAVEGKLDSRTAMYPKIGRGLWRWVLVGGMAVIVLLLLRVLMGGRSPGSLRIVHGPLAEQRFVLRRGRTRIGSLEDNDVVIETQAVSRYHAEIHASRKKIEIEDLRSTNGTQVNGAPIKSSPIQPGDRIRIGDVDMVFER